MALSIIDPPEDDNTPVLELADFENMAIIINAAVRRKIFFDEDLSDAHKILIKIDTFVKHIKKIAKKKNLL